MQTSEGYDAGSGVILDPLYEVAHGTPLHKDVHDGQRQLADLVADAGTLRKVQETSANRLAQLRLQVPERLAVEVMLLQCDQKALDKVLECHRGQRWKVLNVDEQTDDHIDEERPNQQLRGLVVLVRIYVQDPHSGAVQFKRMRRVEQEHEIADTRVGERWQAGRPLEDDVEGVATGVGYQLSIQIAEDLEQVVFEL